MVEVKLGYKEREIAGGSNLRPVQSSRIMKNTRSLYLVRPEDWRATLVRFAQPYKNLMLGRCLAEKWLGDDAGTQAVHLLAIADGATVHRQSSGREWRYADEFAAFRETCVMERGNLHFTTWQDLLKWASEEQQQARLDFVLTRLRIHPLL